MGRQDDMVMRPRFKGDLRTPAQARAAEEKQGEIHRKRGLLRKMARIHAMRKARKLRMARRAAKVNSARAAGSALGKRAGAVAVRTPWGLIATAVIVALAVTVRLISGRSFENMGAQLNKMFLGDMDEEARAAMDVRAQFMSDPDLMRQVANGGDSQAQLRLLFKDLQERRKWELMGASKMVEDKDMQSQGMLDMIILRIANGIRSWWHGSTGPAEVQKIRAGLGSAYDAEAGHSKGWHPGY